MADDKKPKKQQKPQPLPLGALSRTMPTLAQFPEALAEMLNGAPRSAALMGAALLDLNLQDELASMMVAAAVDETDNLFAPGRGPLSATEPKIHLAYCIGFFGKAFRDDMLKICKIRNAFAHSALSISFETSSIKSTCLELKALKKCAERKLLLSPISADALADPRRLFVYSCIHLPHLIFYHRRMSNGVIRENIRLDGSPLP